MNSPVPLPDIEKRDKISYKLFAAYVILVTVLLTIAICALSAMVIRWIDDILPSAAPLLGIDAATAETLSAIFSQLDHAELSVHYGIPAVLSLIFTLCIGLILRAGKKVHKIRFAWFIVISVVVGVIFILFSLGVSVWMTDVNDIRFGDVIKSLMELIGSGILDNL